MTATYTALESDGVGLIAHGHPDAVARLIEQARGLNLGLVCLATDGGLFFVATWPAWVLREVERA
jgi:hypothetical protein